MLKNFFGIRQVYFGDKSNNGCALPYEVFQQYQNSCNITVTLSIFWLVVGDETVPRLTKTTESAIFAASENSSTATLFLDVFKRFHP